LMFVAMSVEPRTPNLFDRHTALDPDLPMRICLEAFPMPGILLAIRVDIGRRGEYGHVVALAARRIACSIVAKAEYLSRTSVVSTVSSERVFTDTASEMLLVVSLVGC
jgi:hypothetical protein